MQTQKVGSSHRGKSCQDSTCPLTAMCTHLTWNKVDNTTLTKPVPRQKSHGEPHFNTLMRQADTAAHRGRGVGVTAHDHNFILPLPAQPLTAVLTETLAQTLYASKGAQSYTKKTNTCATHTKNTQVSVKPDASALLLIVTHCQVARWVLSIEQTEISALAPTNPGNVSSSIWLEQHETVHDAEGSPLSLPKICLHLNVMCWCWK